ncbi:IS3 family transposase [Clostridium botulinum]|uniref:IS3 family transposase n=1 Tax=Clostridium botulinum TaxID=1491 RepID=UPI0035C6B11B
MYVQDLLKKRLKSLYEVDLKKCKNLDELKMEIDNYMNYYNNYIYQWNLNKTIPVQYRNYLSKQ